MRDKSMMIQPIPRETARMAKAVFSRNNYYILVGEQLENILHDIQLENNPGNEFPVVTQIFPLVTYFQFLEGITDFQAEDAVRTRIDWKFALHMAVNVPAFSHNDLCAFRQGIINNAVRQHEFQKLIDRLALINPDAEKETSPMQAMELLTAVCLTNQLNWIFEAMSRVLEYLAGRFPELLREIALPHWYMRYQTHDPFPRWDSREDLLDFFHKVGKDVSYLLESISRLDNAEIMGSSEVGELKRVWIQQYERVDLQNIRVLPRCSFCLTTNEIISIEKSNATKEGLLNQHN